MAYIGPSGSSEATSIADGTIVNADINASAAIATSKITGLATSATTDTTNASNIATGTLPIARIADDAITLAKMASGTDGEIITYDASGNPATVSVGTSGHVLTSGGTGVAPTFQAAAGGGKILQVVNVIENDVVSSSTAYGFDFISASITPSATSSKILVLIMAYMGVNDHGGLQLWKGGSVLTAAIGDVEGGAARTTTGNTKASTEYNTNSLDVKYLDSPATTSSVTYSLRGSASGATMYLNRGYSANLNANTTRSISTITLMEIGA